MRVKIKSFEDLKKIAIKAPKGFTELKVWPSNINWNFSVLHMPNNKVNANDQGCEFTSAMHFLCGTIIELEDWNGWNGFFNNGKSNIFALKFNITLPMIEKLID